MPVIPLTIAQIRAGLQSGFSLDETDQFTYSIPDADSFWESTPGNYEGSNQQPFHASYSVFDAVQAQAFRDALDLWDELILPNFTEVADTNLSHGEVRAAFTSVNMGGATAGYAFQGSNQTPTSIVGDVWINANNTASTFAEGTQDWSTLLHETGHVLGLKHPFEPTVIPDPYDDTRYTVMSYTVPFAVLIAPTGGGGYSIAWDVVTPLTPSVLDIAAVQDIYGADITTRAGDTTYDLASLETDINFRSIYDAGGIDTLDLSDFTRGSIVDLEPGAMSSVGRWLESEQVAYYAALTGDTQANIQTYYDGGPTPNAYYEWIDNLGIAFSTTIENVIGGSGNDTISGNSAANTLIAGAGDDMLMGLAGNDVLYFGANLTGADVAEGGADMDAVVLQGNYTYTFSAGNMASNESISLQSGAEARWGDTANNFYDYNITTVDANVAAGMPMIVNGQSLRVGEDLTFDGSAETDGRFVVYAGHGTDNLTGGSNTDILFFEGTRFGGADVVTGGDGRDALILSAGTGVNVYAFGESQLNGIEAISVNNRYATDPSQMPSYQLTLANGNTPAGQTLIVNGSSLDAGQTITVDGSAETDGRLALYGGSGNDVLTGGGGDDVLYGGDRGDTVTGGAGDDVFRYDSASHSNSTERDGIQDFMLGDIMDVSRIDADTATGGDQAFSFVGSTAFSSTAGELRFENISLGGPIWLLQGDTDGNGVSDFEVVLVITDADPITASDFYL